MAWEPASFLIAAAFGDQTYKVAGYVYRGLGIRQVIKGSPKGRRPPTWSLSHLGSGHGVVLIKGRVVEAFTIANEIADCSDWEFDGLEGWKNRDPELPKKVKAIMDKYPKAVSRGGGHASDEAARAVVMARSVPLSKIAEEAEKQMSRPYSPATLAERWDCTPQAVHRLIRKGALSCFRVGALVRIPAEEVERIECATASQGPEKESSSSSGTMTKVAATEARFLRLTSGRRSTTPASSSSD